MIAYILTSYMVMFVWMGVSAFRFPVDTKLFIKSFVLAPLTMPMIAIMSIARW